MLGSNLNCSSLLIPVYGIADVPALESLKITYFGVDSLVVPSHFAGIILLSTEQISP
jgi:hypothetical protein